MAQVLDYEGIPVNVPETLNGRELRETLKIPPNKILTQIDKNGNEKVVDNDDVVKVSEGDQFDSTTNFARGLF